MTKRIAKREWERRKSTIKDLYRTHQLSEVIKIMADEYGFAAERRQYVYRLEQWKIRKYKVTPGEANSSSECEEENEEDDDDDDLPGENSLVNTDGLAPPVPRVDNRLSPYSDGPSPSKRTLDHLRTTTPSSQDSQTWNEEQRERLDLMLAFPNNTFASERCLSLWRSFPGDIRAGRLGQAVLYACVRLDIGHQADNVHQALKDMHPRVQTFVDRLRLNLLRYFLQGPNGLSMPAIFKDVDHFLKEPEADLGLFPLVLRFVSQHVDQLQQPSTRGQSHLPSTFGQKNDVVNNFASKLARCHEATHILRSCVQWCQQTYGLAAGHTSYLDMQNQSLTSDQTRQLGIAEVACALTKHLLREPYGLPRLWVQDLRSHLGISPVACVATVTRMASNYCQRHLPPFRPLNAYEKMENHTYEMLLRSDGRILWREFLDALLEVDETSTMASLSQAFQDVSNGQFGQAASSTHMENHTFFSKLNPLVQSFVCEHLAPEIRDADSERQSLCPDLDVTPAGSHQGSHSPATPAMIGPASLHNHFPMDDASDMAAQIPQDVSLMGLRFYGQSYCDVDQSPEGPAFYGPGIYLPG